MSVIEEGLITGHCPIANLYETMSMCALIIMALFLVVHWRYKIESFSVFLFPAGLRDDAGRDHGTAGSARGRARRSAMSWLTTHIVLVLLGYAALLLTAVSSVVYLIQERELKRKSPRQFYYRLPPLGTLDELISRFMAAGFVFITLATIAGSTWAFIEFGHELDFRPQHQHFVRDLGHLPGDGLLARHRRMARRKAAIMAITALGCSADHLGRAQRPAAQSDAMKLLITGVSHKTAPVEIRERLAFPRRRCPRRCVQLKSRDRACPKR